MLTDYFVRCARVGCDWRGCLFPEGSREAWRPAVPSVREVNFRCPRCQQVWRARIVGEDAIALPLEPEVPASQSV